MTTKTFGAYRDLDLRPLLDGKVAITTGASRGIGAATARALSAEGASVALAARDQAALESLAEELSNDGTGAIAVPTDARSTRCPSLDAAS